MIRHWLPRVLTLLCSFFRFMRDKSVISSNIIVVFTIVDLVINSGINPSGITTTPFLWPGVVYLELVIKTTWLLQIRVNNKPLIASSQSCWSWYFTMIMPRKGFALGIYIYIYKRNSLWVYNSYSFANRFQEKASQSDVLFVNVLTL